jgi:hypothetical protein
MRYQGFETFRVNSYDPSPKTPDQWYGAHILLFNRYRFVYENE